MTSRVQHKRSSVAANVPVAGTLAIGEMAINFADRYIYTKNGASAVIRLTGHLPLVQPVANQIEGDTYIDTITGKLYSYFSLNGAGVAWNELVPTIDFTPFVRKDGSVAMTGQLLLLGGASTGEEAVGFTQISTMIAASATAFVNKDGSTVMTGRQTLFADPTSALHAATKQYVDTAVSIATPDLSAYLAKVGGVMVGQITLPGGGTGNQAVTANELAAGFAAHVALPDPHTQYATDIALNAHKAAGGSEHPAATGSVNGFFAAADKTRLDTMTVAADADVTTGTDNAKYLTSLRLATYLTPKLRVKLSANANYYVRTDGSNSNTGLANTAGAAFLTIQKAIDTITSFDFNGFTATIHVADGTYSAVWAISTACVGQKNTSDFLIQGNTTTPANVLISLTGGVTNVTISNGARCKIEGFKFTSSGAGGNAIIATTYADVDLGKNEYGGINTTAIQASLYATISLSASYAINGSQAAHFNARECGTINVPAAITATATGVLTIGVCANATRRGQIFANNLTMTGGTITGNRSAGASGAYVYTGDGSGVQTRFLGSGNGTFSEGAVIF